MATPTNEEEAWAEIETARCEMNWYARKLKKLLRSYAFEYPEHANDWTAAERRLIGLKANAAVREG